MPGLPFDPVLPSMSQPGGCNSCGAQPPSQSICIDGSGNVVQWSDPGMTTCGLPVLPPYTPNVKDGPGPVIACPVVALL